MASQSNNSYTLLPEQAQEDALHFTRLLAVESRPFDRVRELLLGSKSLLTYTPPQQLPSPPPDGIDPAGSAPQTEPTEEARKRQIFREDVLLDFKALESSLLRIQLILDSNARERERYAAEKARIVATAQSVRDNTASLRVQLSEAQRVLELRKGYDELAAKLIDPKKLKPRAETREDIEKIEKEIEDLEQESADFEGTWQGRREAFDRVVEEGRIMMNVVKGIKDEPEKMEDEHMEDGEGEGAKGGEGSQIGTPAPGRTPMHRERTPQPDVEEGRSGDMLEADDERATRGSSRVASPAPRGEDRDEVPATDDIEMTQDDRDEPTLESQPKTTSGMEVSSDQVATPAEGMEGTEDRQPEGAVAAEDFDEDQEETNALAVEPVENVEELEEVDEEPVGTPAVDLAESMDES